MKLRERLLRHLAQLEPVLIVSNGQIVPRKGIRRVKRQGLSQFIDRLLPITAVQSPYALVVQVDNLIDVRRKRRLPKKNDTGGLCTKQSEFFSVSVHGAA